MCYRTIFSKIAGIALALFLAGCNENEEVQTEEETTFVLESIEVSPATVSLTMITDETEQLTATTTPEDAPEVKISWVSANEMVATVSATGLVTAKKVGQTKVSAIGGGVRKDVLVTVVSDASLVTVEPVSLTVTFGDAPVKLSINSKPGISIVECSFSSSNTNVAKVGADSTVTFVGVGSAEITVISKLDSAGSINVESIVPVTVQETSLGLFGPHTLTAEGLTIPIVNFDRGGEGVAYHDIDVANKTNTNYRAVNGDLNCGVDIEGSIDNPNICYTATGEWLNYTLNVRDAGIYVVSVNLSSDASTGKFHLEADGVNFTGTQSIPDNGGWSAWRWQEAGAIRLSAGTHVIKYAIEGNEGNLKDIKFEWLDPATFLTGYTVEPTSLTVVFGNSPVKLNLTNKAPENTSAKFLFSSTNTNVATVATDGTVTFTGVGSAEIVVVGRGYYADDVERRVSVSVAEDKPGIFGPHTLTSAGLSIPIVNFDRGGEGVAYHDIDVANKTNTNYRAVNGDLNCGVDIEGSIDNPNICYTATGEWLKYTLNVRDAGTYAVSVNLSSDESTGKFHLEADGVNFSGTVSVPDNGGWSNWRWWPTEAPTVYLTAGTHVITYSIEGNDCNLKDIRFEWRE